eukprot:PhM_4_TR16805/c0_g1_i8/m.52136
MKLISIRALSIGLSLTLIIATAVICLTLSLTTAEDALSSTERTGKDGIASAFAAAEDNVQDLSGRLMAELLRGAKQYTADMMDAQVRLARGISRYISILSKTPNAVTSLDIFDAMKLKDSLIPITSVVQDSRATALMVFTVTGAILLFTESESSLGTNRTRENFLVFNNGTDTALPIGQKYSIGGDVDEYLQYKSPAFDCTRANLCNPANIDQAVNWGPCPASSNETCSVDQYKLFDPLSQVAA